VGARFFAPVQTGPGAHPASCTMGTGSFPGVKRPGRDADHLPPCSAEVTKGKSCTYCPVQQLLLSAMHPHYLPLLRQLFLSVGLSILGIVRYVVMHVELYPVYRQSFQHSPQHSVNLSVDTSFAFLLSWLSNNNYNRIFLFFLAKRPFIHTVYICVKNKRKFWKL
jgi:hypothetical protein